MAYDEALAERPRAALAGEDAVSQRKMFGGLAFMLRGNMFDLMVGAGPERYEELLERPHARPMDFTAAR